MMTVINNGEEKLSNLFVIAIALVCFPGFLWAIDNEMISLIRIESSALLLLAVLSAMRLINALQEQLVRLQKEPSQVAQQVQLQLLLSLHLLQKVVESVLQQVRVLVLFQVVLAMDYTVRHNIVINLFTIKKEEVSYDNSNIRTL